METAGDQDSPMKIVVKDLREEDAFGRTLVVEVPAEEVDGEVERAIGDLRREVALPGFRKGKAPHALVKTRYGDGVRADVVERVVRDALWQAVKEKDLHPIAPPHVAQVNHGDGRSLSFTARVDVRPAVEPGDPTGVRVDRVVVVVDDEKVDAIIESLRDSLAKFEVVSRPAASGDVVTVDLAELGPGQVPILGQHREGIRLELAEGLTPVPWIEALGGRRAGESVVVEVPPPAAEEGELPPAAGARYHRIDLKQVESKTLPALGEAFARALGMGAATVEELRAKVRARLEADEERRSQRTLERELLDRLASTIRVEIPERILKPAADRLYARAIEDFPGLEAGARERLAVEAREVAAQEVRRELVIAAVARAQEIQVGDDEAEAELRRVERQSRRQGEPAPSRSGSERAERLDHVRDLVLERKVLKYLVDRADVQVVQQSSKRKRIVTPYDP